MKISAKQYAEVLFDIVKTKKELDLDRSIIKFAEVLTKRNEQFMLEKISLELSILWNKEFSILNAEIESARPIDAKTIKVLTEKIRGLSEVKEIILTEKVDSKLIGGAVIRYGDKILDASLKTRLDKFKESIIV